MLLNDAIRQRLKNIIDDKNIKSNYVLSYGAGLNPSLINDFFRDRIKYPRIDTLYLICESLNMTLEEFFNDPLFNIENIEVQKDSK